MSDVIIVVDENDIELSSSFKTSVSEVQIGTNETIVVVPSYNDTAQGTTVTVTPDVIEVTPAIFPPHIVESYGIQELYILVVDVELLEAWQHQLNDVSALVNSLVLRCLTIENSISNIDTDIANIDIAIANLETDVANITTRIDALVVKFTALKAIVDNHTELLNSLGLSIDNVNQLIINLNTSLTSLDGRITANATLLQSYEVSITENKNAIHAMATSVTNLGVTVSNLETDQVANSNLIVSLKADVVSINGRMASMSSAITAINSDIETIDGRVIANASAADTLFTQVSTLDGHLSALAAHTEEIRAEIPTTFNPTLAWEFLTDLEGWVASNTANVSHDANTAILSGNGQFGKVFDEAVDGAVNDTITFRWKVTLETGNWIGEVYYTYSGGTTSVLAGTFEHTYGYSEYQQTTITGDWEDRQITSISIYFADSGTFVIDSVGIGYKSSFGALAYVKKEAVAWVREDEAYAHDIETLHAEIEGVEGTIVTEAEIDAKIDGSITSRWSLDVTAGNSIVGLKMTAGDGTNLTSSFRVNATDFIINSPATGDKAIFEVYTDTASNSFIRLSNDVKITQDIQSDNYNPNPGSYAGWKIAQNGEANFHGINIYNTAGDLILSSGSGLNTSGLVADIQDDMATALLNTASTSGDFVSNLYSDIQADIEADAATYIRTLLIGKAWINDAFIKTLHVEDLAVDTSKIGYNGVSSFTFFETGAHTIVGDVVIFNITLEVPAVLAADGSNTAPYIIFDIRIRYLLDAYNSGITVKRGSTTLLTQILPAYPGIYSHAYATCTDHFAKGLTPGTQTIQVILNGPSSNFSISDGDLSIQIMKR